MKSSLKFGYKNYLTAIEGAYECGVHNATLYYSFSSGFSVMQGIQVGYHLDEDEICLEEVCWREEQPGIYRKSVRPTKTCYDLFRQHILHMQSQREQE